MREETRDARNLVRGEDRIGQTRGGLGRWRCAHRGYRPNAVSEWRFVRSVAPTERKLPKRSGQMDRRAPANTWVR